MITSDLQIVIRNPGRVGNKVGNDNFLSFFTKDNIEIMSYILLSGIIIKRDDFEKIIDIKWQKK